MSIWHEEIDRALIKELKNIKLLNGDDVPVIIRNPSEVVDISKPCISIYHYDEILDKFRFDWNPVILEKDYDNNLIFLEESAIPYNIFIQIDIWATKHKELNSLSMQYCKDFNVKTYIDILNTEGINIACTLHHLNHNYMEEKKDTYNLLRKTYSIMVKVELNRDNKIVKTMVNSLMINNL